MRAQFDDGLRSHPGGRRQAAPEPGLRRRRHCGAEQTAAQNLAAHSTGTDRHLRASRAVPARQARRSHPSPDRSARTAQSCASMVSAIVADAEKPGRGIAAASRPAPSTNSRIWLMLIALSTLVIAGLIVWLFVHRYVVSRLDALADSMLGIARGNLAMPIPAAGPDELGEMSRALDRVPRQRARHPGRAGSGDRGSRRGRGGIPRQVDVPRQHEPRTAHAAQRDHRLQRNPGRGRHRSRRRQRACAICRKSSPRANICSG